MTERRALARHKTLISGRIYFNNRLSSVDCIVRDLSDNGSRLEVSDSVTLPEVFEIYLPNKDEYFHAKMEWRKGNIVGISWTPEQPPKRPEQPGSESSIAERVTKLEHDVMVLQRRLDSLQEL
jgi:hypothetical protein